MQNVKNNYLDCKFVSIMFRVQSQKKEIKIKIWSKCKNLEDKRFELSKVTILEDTKWNGKCNHFLWIGA